MSGGIRDRVLWPSPRPGVHRKGGSLQLNERLRAEARGDRLWLAAGAGKAAGQPAPRLADEHLVGIADLH